MWLLGSLKTLLGWDIAKNGAVNQVQFVIVPDIDSCLLQINYINLKCFKLFALSMWFPYTITHRGLWYKASRALHKSWNWKSNSYSPPQFYVVVGRRFWIYYEIYFEFGNLFLCSFYVFLFSFFLLYFSFSHLCVSFFLKLMYQDESHHEKIFLDLIFFSFVKSCIWYFFN